MLKPFNDSILAPQTEAPADESPNTQSQRMKFIRQREGDHLRKERQRQRISEDPIAEQAERSRNTEDHKQRRQRISENPEERNIYLYNDAQSQKRYRQRSSQRGLIFRQKIQHFNAFLTMIYQTLAIS